MTLHARLAATELPRSQYRPNSRIDNSRFWVSKRNHGYFLVRMIIVVDVFAPGKGSLPHVPEFDLHALSGGLLDLFSPREGPVQEDGPLALRGDVRKALKHLTTSAACAAERWRAFRPGAHSMGSSWGADFDQVSHQIRSAIQEPGRSGKRVMDTSAVPECLQALRCYEGVCRSAETDATLATVLAGARGVADAFVQLSTALKSALPSTRGRDADHWYREVPLRPLLDFLSKPSFVGSLTPLITLRNAERQHLAPTGAHGVVTAEFVALVLAGQSADELGEQLTELVEVGTSVERDLRRLGGLARFADSSLRHVMGPLVPQLELALPAWLALLESPHTPAPEDTTTIPQLREQIRALERTCKLPAPFFEACYRCLDLSIEILTGGQHLAPADEARLSFSTLKKRAVAMADGLLGMAKELAVEIDTGFGSDSLKAFLQAQPDLLLLDEPEYRRRADTLNDACAALSRAGLLQTWSPITTPLAFAEGALPETMRLAREKVLAAAGFEAAEIRHGSCGDLAEAIHIVSGLARRTAIDQAAVLSRLFATELSPASFPAWKDAADAVAKTLISAPKGFSSAIGEDALAAEYIAATAGEIRAQMVRHVLADIGVEWRSGQVDWRVANARKDLIPPAVLAVSPAPLLLSDNAFAEYREALDSVASAQAELLKLAPHSPLTSVEAAMLLPDVIGSTREAIEAAICAATTQRRLEAEAFDRGLSTLWWEEHTSSESAPLDILPFGEVEGRLNALERLLRAQGLGDGAPIVAAEPRAFCTGLRKDFDFYLVRLGALFQRCRRSGSAYLAYSESPAQFTPSALPACEARLTSK